MAECYIEFKNVVKKFDSFVALDHVSLQIPRGRSSRCSARPAAAKPPSCASSPGFPSRRRAT